jgi:hypothetical protein
MPRPLVLRPVCVTGGRPAPKRRWEAARGDGGCVVGGATRCRGTNSWTAMACGWMRRRRRLAGGYGGGLVILEVSVEQKWDKKREKILHRAATWWAPVWVVFLAPRWSTRVGAGATDNYSGSVSRL